MVLQLIAVFGIVTLAWMAVRASHLLVAVLDLAGASVFVSILLYLLGAREVAVIELSVGAGLVTVMLILTASIAGEDLTGGRSVVPQTLALMLPVLALLVTALLVLPPPPPAATEATATFATTLWQTRAADVLLQSVLMFAGLLTVLGLLAETRTIEITAKAQRPVTEAAPAELEKERVV